MNNDTRRSDDDESRIQQPSHGFERIDSIMLRLHLSTEPFTNQPPIPDDSTYKTFTVPLHQGTTLLIEVSIQLKREDCDPPWPPLTGSNQGSEGTAPKPAYGSLSKWRESRILQALMQLGYMPAALAPLAGSTRLDAKRQTFALLTDGNDKAFWSAAAFEKSWQALRVVGRIVDAEQRPRKTKVGRPRVKARRFTGKAARGAATGATLTKGQ